LKLILEDHSAIKNLRVSRIKRSTSKRNSRRRQISVRVIDLLKEEARNKSKYFKLKN